MFVLSSVRVSNTVENISLRSEHNYENNKKTESSKINYLVESLLDN